jgi:hypothetical protein
MAMESPVESSLESPMESQAIIKRINFHRQGWVDRSFKDAETNVPPLPKLISGHPILLRMSAEMAGRQILFPSRWEGWSSPRYDHSKSVFYGRYIPICE